MAIISPAAAKLTLNHVFLPGEGKSTPSEYERAGHIPDFVLDDIADWIKKKS